MMQLIREGRPSPPAPPLPPELRERRTHLDRLLLELLAGEREFAAALTRAIPLRLNDGSLAILRENTCRFRAQADAAGLDAEIAANAHSLLTTMFPFAAVQPPDLTASPLEGIVPIMLGARNSWGEFTITHAEQYAAASVVHVRFLAVVPENTRSAVDPQFSLLVSGPAGSPYNVSEMGGRGSHGSRTYTFALQPALPADPQGINFSLIPPVRPRHRPQPPQPLPLEDTLDLLPPAEGSPK